jgi:hypothetical protein
VAQSAAMSSARPLRKYPPFDAGPPRLNVTFRD